MLTNVSSPLNMNGSEVIAHDPVTGTTFIRLPEALWRVCGDHMCLCPSCIGKTAGFWDALAIPTKGHAWTVHMPPGNIPMFRKELEKKVEAKKAKRKAKKVAKTPNPEKGAPWE